MIAVSPDASGNLTVEVRQNVTGDGNGSLTNPAIFTIGFGDDGRIAGWGWASPGESSGAGAEIEAFGDRLLASRDASIDGGEAGLSIGYDFSQFKPPPGPDGRSYRAFLMGTSRGDGTSVHRVVGAGLSGVEVAAFHGPGVQALELRDIDSGGGVRASLGSPTLRAGPATVGFRVETATRLAREIRAPCGLTGIFLVSHALGLSVTNAGYRNDLGDDESALAIEAAEWRYRAAEGERIDQEPIVLPFSSPAQDWRFFIDGRAAALTSGDLALVAADVSIEPPQFAPGPVTARPCNLPDP